MMTIGELTKLYIDTAQTIVEGLGVQGDAVAATITLAARLSETVDDFVSGRSV